MSLIDTVKDSFNQALQEFTRSEAARRIVEPGLSRAHYGSVLREIYHYAKEDPQLQALAAVHFRGDDRSLVKMFFQHAISEIGHDLMALEDLRALGEDPSAVPTTNPLPETIALTGYAFFQIGYRHPIGYLGYLYFLEHMPTQMGAAYAEALLKAGIPQEALHFLGEHATVDVGHNKLMERYLARLIHTERDAAEVAYAMRVTGRLYASMLLAAMNRADSGESFGIDLGEAERMRAGATSDDAPIHH